MFCTWSITLWKTVSHEPPLPLEITGFESPSPAEFPMIFRGGGGGGGDGYFLEPHIVTDPDLGQPN